jgi:hypothetical protein
MQRLRNEAKAEVGRLLRVLLLWLGAVPAHSGGALRRERRIILLCEQIATLTQARATGCAARAPACWAGGLRLPPNMHGGNSRRRVPSSPVVAVASFRVKPFCLGCATVSIFRSTTSRTLIRMNGFWASFLRSTMKPAVADSAAIQTSRTDFRA